MRRRKGLVRRLVLRALRENLPPGSCLPEMGDALLELGLDSVDRATLAMALEEDLMLGIGEKDRDAAWADVMGGDITLEDLTRKMEAMAGRQ